MFLQRYKKMSFRKCKTLVSNQLAFLNCLIHEILVENLLMTEFHKYIIICVIGFVTVFACYAANTCAKTIFYIHFTTGFTRGY
jgi:uncharacterized membrane protein